MFPSFSEGGQSAQAVNKGAPSLAGRSLFAKRSAGLFCKFSPLRSALRSKEFRLLRQATKGAAFGNCKPFEKSPTENFAFWHKKKARLKPDFLYKRQSPVPTLAFGRRYGNNNENNSTWIHDRGITIKGNRTRCCPRTSMFADSFSAAEITPAPEGYHIAVRRARRSGEGCPQ